MIETQAFKGFFVLAVLAFTATVGSASENKEPGADQAFVCTAGRNYIPAVDTTIGQVRFQIDNNCSENIVVYLSGPDFPQSNPNPYGVPNRGDYFFSFLDYLKGFVAGISSDGFVFHKFLGFKFGGTGITVNYKAYNGHIISTGVYEDDDGVNDPALSKTLDLDTVIELANPNSYVDPNCGLNCPEA